jgi:hypothetical protein
MPEFPDASIEASKIVEDPTRLDRMDAAYVLVRDTSMMGTFKNLMDAVNMLAERGWEVINMVNNESGMIHVMMRNPYFKQKNQPNE